MTKQFVKVTIPVHCDWYGDEPPAYRFYVNGEMFTERSFRFQKPKYLVEILQILAEPGDYNIQFEKISPNGEFTLGEPEVIFGPGNFESQNVLRIWQ